jgi:WD40 repeat protein
LSLGLGDKRCVEEDEGASSSLVLTLAVSRDGQMIASGDGGGKLIAWHGENG